MILVVMNVYNIRVFLSNIRKQVTSIERNHFLYWTCCTYIKKQILGTDKGIPFTISRYTHVPDLYNYFVGFFLVNKLFRKLKYIYFKK